MTVLTNVFDGQSVFRSVEALAGSEVLFSRGIAPTIAELELANLPPLEAGDDGASAEAVTDGARAVAGATDGTGGALAAAGPVAAATGGGALAAVAAAVSVDGGDLPLDADLAAAALLGPTAALAVAAGATVGSGSSAIDVAAAAALGTGTLGSGIPLVDGLLGGTGDGTSPVGHLPIIGDLLSGTGLGGGGPTSGLPILGDLLGQGTGDGGLLHGFPVVGNPLSNVGNGIADSTTPTDGPLVAEVLNLPLELLGLNDTTGNLEGALNNAGIVVAGAGTLVDSLGTDLGNVFEQRLATTANDVVADAHIFLETVGHEVVLNQAIHGVTRLGNEVGLGELGGDNLLTDVLEVPGVVLNGGDIGNQLGDINADVGNILTAVPPIVTGAILDLNDGTFGADVTGNGGIVANLADALSGTSTTSLPIISDLGDSLTIPSLGGAGADSLVGTLADTVQSVPGVVDQVVQPLAVLDLGDILDPAGNHHVPDATGQDCHGPLGLGLI